MILLNLLFYCFCFYFITTVNFYTKVSCFIFFSLLSSCFLNMNNIKNSDNIFSKYLYLLLKSSINLKNILVNFCYYLSTFKFIKVMIYYVKLLDKSYIDGRKYLFLKLTSKLKIPSNNNFVKTKMNKDKKNKDKKNKDKKNKNDGKVFKSKDEMNNFLDTLKKIK